MEMRNIGSLEVSVVGLGSNLLDTADNYVREVGCSNFTGAMLQEVDGPVASVIAGATSPVQVRTNVEAGRWRPDASELAGIPVERS
jgi:hypothetical protein